MRKDLIRKKRLGNFHCTCNITAICEGAWKDGVAASGSIIPSLSLEHFSFQPLLVFLFFFLQLSSPLSLSPNLSPFSLIPKTYYHSL